MQQKVLLGMSGGTDSSVSAMLLQDAGYEVIGATLRLWSQSDDFEQEQEPQYLLDARRLAEELGIEHHVIDAKAPFYEQVIRYFKEEYLAGRTPNPCAKCNVVLKWRLLTETADRLGCHYLATGHYNQVEEVDGYYYIRKGLDPEKEQSFFLWGLSQEVLSRALFPLGKFTKEEVRAIATAKGFKRIATQKESIGVCFIHGGNYQPFLKSLMDTEGLQVASGDFVDEEGQFIARHQGYPFYTVGQRRGLGLSPNEPWYVTRINAQKNQIVLGKRQDLYQQSMLVKDYNLINPADFKQEVITRVRYRKQAALSRVEILDDTTLKVHFIEPEWSIAPGQTAAFYLGDRLLGGGFIES